MQEANGKRVKTQQVYLASMKRIKMELWVLRVLRQNTWSEVSRADFTT
jgi:hypothetical protein